MSMIEIDYNPSRKKLRDFGIIALVASIILSLLLYFFKHLAIQWIFIIISAGLFIFLSSLISSKFTRLIYLGLTFLTYPIGFVVNSLVMGIFYFLIITPVGIIFKLSGKDPLHRKFDYSTKSYWLKRQSPDKLDRYFHQF
ncbi:MAG: hypothetical protein JXA96_09515 [Sedimentisphaerales bacterium]|nr:hypothetical protein [Sedimentisphaerales bacterium]